MTVSELSFDAHVARDVAGELGVHLRIVGEALGVEVSQRGTVVRVSAEGGGHDAAVRVLDQLGRMAAGGRALQPGDVRDALRILAEDPGIDLSAWYREVLLLDVKKKPIVARSLRQRAYVAAMRSHDVVFGVGPAGTGKTWLAMAVAVGMLRKGVVRRIVLTRPAVEAGEKLGFLPGDLTEKVDPYLRPLFDALADMVEQRELQDLLQRNVIEVAPLAFMRGRTLQDAFVVLDEAQNTTVEQMKMFLTRLGTNSRMVITGDPSQVDLPRDKRSGLAHALGLLDGVDGIAMVRLSAADIVRHPVVARIVAAYEGER
jgi:phosphate starvation-inducible PhoH-like protein